MEMDINFCDGDIFKNGFCLARLPSFVTKTQANELCEKLNILGAGINVFDWHYAAGWVMLLYAGDYENAKRLFESQPNYESSWDPTQTLSQQSQIYPPNHKSMGQVIN